MYTISSVCVCLGSLLKLLVLKTHARSTQKPRIATNIFAFARRRRCRARALHTYNTYTHTLSHRRRDTHSPRKEHRHRHARSRIRVCSVFRWYISSARILCATHNIRHTHPPHKRARIRCTVASAPATKTCVVLLFRRVITARACMQIHTALNVARYCCLVAHVHVVVAFAVCVVVLVVVLADPFVWWSSNGNARARHQNRPATFLISVQLFSVRCAFLVVACGARRRCRRRCRVSLLLPPATVRRQCPPVCRRRFRFICWPHNCTLSICTLETHTRRTLTPYKQTKRQATYETTV